MVEAGATPMRCPHCDAETPIYASEYDTAGNPVSFTVCLWCGGIVEFSEMTEAPHEPYATTGDLPMNRADRTE
jgi:hypothetical protein